MSGLEMLLPLAASAAAPALEGGAAAGLGAMAAPLTFGSMPAGASLLAPMAGMGSLASSMVPEMAGTGAMLSTTGMAQQGIPMLLESMKMGGPSVAPGMIDQTMAGLRLPADFSTMASSMASGGVSPIDKANPWLTGASASSNVLKNLIGMNRQPMMRPAPPPNVQGGVTRPLNLGNSARAPMMRPLERFALMLRRS
jgi:hypothetical protein